MKKYLFALCLLTFKAAFIFAQVPVSKNIDIKSVILVDDEGRLLKGLDTLLAHAANGTVQINETAQAGAMFSRDILNTLKGVESNEREKIPNYYKPQLISLYKTGDGQYMVSVAFMNENSLRAIIELIAAENNGHYTFSLPLYYYTHTWKITTIGNITYHYPDNMNNKRAKIFDHKNMSIASKLGMPPEKFDFYLCNNYQDILHLQGFAYDSEAAGIVTDGYGPGDSTIFSIMHNEDFSHDVFHYYAAKIRKNSRNSASEEGLAYSWGNAYYTDEHGEMISQQQLVVKFKVYLQQHPQSSLFELFSKGPFIFGDETKVRSLLASLICDEVERKGGITAIKELIDCGRGDDNFFRITTKYTGISPANFDLRVKELLEKYK
jgi:hypothetical protein